MKDANMVEIKLLSQCQAHIPKLATLWYEGISKHWVPQSSYERNTQQLHEHLNEVQLPLTLVALHDNEVLGMASLRLDDGLSSAHAPWLGSLVVDPLYQKKGVGTHLINAVKDKARDLNFTTLYLLAFDKTIPDWYKKLGWQTIGTDQMFNHPITIMEIGL